MAENKARFSAEFTSQGADQLKRDLQDVREGRKELNAVIGNGARVSQDAAQGMDASAQATQNVLKSVEDSTRALQAAFTALPQGVQQSLAQVMDNIRQADFVGAMQEKARVDVFHHGLDNVRVEGLQNDARRQAEEALRGFGTAIRTPPNHRGMG